MWLLGSGAGRLCGRTAMRLLVTGVSGLIGSNVAAAAAQQSWSVLGTWRETPVSLLGARTAQLDVSDRHACVTLAEELEPDVVVHAGAPSGDGPPGARARSWPRPTSSAPRTRSPPRTRYGPATRWSPASTSSAGAALEECWDEEDPTEPTTALGRSLLAREQLVQDFGGSWLITRPADVYGVNLAIPAGVNLATPAGAEVRAPLPHDPLPPVQADERVRYVWERSGQPLRWVTSLRAGRLLLAPAGVRRSPTYAWDYAQRLCELIAQECEGLFNTAGPTTIGRLAQMRLLARAFGCEMELVRDGPTGHQAPHAVAAGEHGAVRPQDDFHAGPPRGRPVQRLPPDAPPARAGVGLTHPRRSPGRVPHPGRVAARRSRARLKW